MYRSTQEETNFRRDSSVAAASEKYLDQLHPPSEITVLSRGFSALSLRSWLKWPLSFWPGRSATPSTESAAENGRW